jgi:hypothetical protein
MRLAVLNDLSVVRFETVAKNDTLLAEVVYERAELRGKTVEELAGEREGPLGHIRHRRHRRGALPLRGKRWAAQGDSQDGEAALASPFTELPRE